MRAPRTRPLALVGALTLLLLVAPPVGLYEAEAVPRAVTSTMDGLPSRAGDGISAQSAAASEHTSRRVRADMPFSMVGFTVPDDVDHVEVRTSVDGDEWSQWAETHVEELERPDAGSAEGRPATTTSPVWTGEARHLQVRVEGGSPRTSR